MLGFPDKFESMKSKYCMYRAVYLWLYPDFTKFVLTTEASDDYFVVA